MVEKRKQERNAEKKKEEKCNKIDEVCNKGTIEDLLNLKSFFEIFVVFALFSGCVSGKQPVVETTRQWENHYFSVEDFKNGTKNMELKKGESVWVLSNSTLSRFLKTNCFATEQGK